MRTSNAGVERIGGARRRRPAGAFTLVEIVAAMALAVLIMLGMVQVFKMASEAVSNTEATTDSYQMARGIFSGLQKDLLGFTPEGYLYVQPQRIFNPHGRTCTADRTPTCRKELGTNPSGSESMETTKHWYNFDTLAFTAVGRNVEMGLGSNNPEESSSAEIVYTYGRRAANGKINPWAGTPFTNADSRGTCLVREAFLNAGELTGHIVAPFQSVKWTRSSFIMMQQENEWKVSPKYRVSPMRIGSSDGFGNMAQKIDADERGGFDSDVNYIVSDRVSEFMVEVWAYANGELGWQRPIGEPIKTDGSPHYLWCGTKRNPKGEVTYKYSNPTREVTYTHFTMPNKIRVTVVIHPHNDQAPLEDHDYSTPSTFKYRGDVFRQVFRLSGVRGGRAEISGTSTSTSITD